MARNTLFQWLDISMRFCLLSSHSLPFLKHEEKPMRACDIDDYLTRSRFNLHKMSLRYQFAISSQAPTIWNDIPLTVRGSLTTTNFKKKQKLHFLSAGFS